MAETLILTHTRADFDAIASAIAARILHPQARIVLPDALNANVRQFVGLYGESLGLIPLHQAVLSEARHVILVDTQDTTRTGASLPSGLSWTLYDHHPLLPEAPVHDGEVRPVGAATTLLVTRIREKGLPVGELEATVLLLGIYEDTGRLSYPITTPEDAEAVAFLLHSGARLDLVASFLEAPLSHPQQDLLSELLASVETVSVGASDLSLSGVKTERHVDGIALVAGRLMELLGTDAIVVAVGMPGRTQIVGRGREGSVDIRQLLGLWNPKGHPTAVAAHTEATAADVMASVRERAAQLPLTEPRAADLMSYPVRSIGPQTSVSEALGRLVRSGHTAMPVAEGDRPLGVISRRDLERALHHGMDAKPIKGLMSRRLITVGEQTPLSEIRRMMVELDIGRVLVLREGALVGVVTRSDVLRALHMKPSDPSMTDLKAMIEERMPADWLQLLETVGRIAGATPVYLIGGAVRDLLLDTHGIEVDTSVHGAFSFDLDLVVQGDAIVLGDAIATALGGSAKPHDRFGTCHVHLASGKRIDLATARIERYPHPGSLPEVEPSTLHQDLSRRDFSINALALRLNPDHFGELVDFFGGREDLRQGHLRVLHPLSFIEDPTRILRGLRFEARLGFRMAPETESYARYALSSGRFDGMAGERLKRELLAGFTLASMPAWARRASELTAWRLLNPSLKGTRPTLRSLRRFARLRSDEPRAPVALGMLLTELSEADRPVVAQNLQLTKDQTAVVLEVGRILDDYRAGSLMGPAPHLARRLASVPEPICSALYASATREDRFRLKAYWQGLRTRKPTLSGDRLREMGLPPGPRYREVLEALQDALWEGKIHSVEEEESFVRRLIQDPGA